MGHLLVRIGKTCQPLKVVLVYIEPQRLIYGVDSFAFPALLMLQSKHETALG